MLRYPLQQTDVFLLVLNFQPNILKAVQAQITLHHDAELSEPEQPLVYWVENSTPEEIRPFVVKGIEAWNKAFEKAGFKNAIVAKIQPDDAEWDAGDVRYNVVRWASTPSPRYSRISR